MAAMVAATAATSPPSTAAPEMSAEDRELATVPPISPEEERAYAIKFRKSFGLPFDQATLDAANAAPHPEGQSRYGVALTAAEYAEQAARDRRQEAAAPIDRAVNAHPDELAGMWIDQQNGGAFVVMALPSASPLTRAAVVAAAPPGATVRFETVPLSATVLSGAHAALTRHQIDATEPNGAKPDNPLVELKRRGFFVNMTAVDGRANRVVVFVEDLQEHRVEELNSAWDSFVATRKLPDRQLLVIRPGKRNESTATRSDSPGPMQGGLELLGGIGTQYRCTSNMSATGFVQLTAGHCYEPGTRVHQKYIYMGTVGTGVEWDGWFNGSRADYVAFSLRAGGYSTPYVFAAYGCGSNTCQQIDTASSVQNPVSLGMRACASGDSSYRIHCGTVILSNVTTTVSSNGARFVDTVTLQDQAAVDYMIQQGDSGGVVGDGPAIFGIISGNSGVGMIFRRMHLALAQMNRQMVTAPQGAVPPHWGLLQSGHSGRCADVQWNSATNGAAVWGYGCNGNPAQQWKFMAYGTGHVCCHLPWQIRRAALPGKALDADIAVGAPNGAKVQQWDWLGGQNQVWKLYRNPGTDKTLFKMASGYNGRCMDKDINMHGDGEKYQVWDCNDQLQQMWRLS